MGFSIRELLSPPLNDVTRHMLPSLRREQQERFRRRLAGGRAPGRYEFPMLHRNGRAVWVDCTFTRFIYRGAPAIQTTLIDSTGRRATAARLQQSEETCRRLIDASPDGIAVECAGKLAYINLAGARMLKAARPRQLIGRPVLEFVHPADRVGLPCDFDRPRPNSLGFQLVAALAAQMRGRVRIGRGKGTAVSVSFPLFGERAWPSRKGVRPRPGRAS